MGELRLFRHHPGYAVYPILPLEVEVEWTPPEMPLRTAPDRAGQVGNGRWRANLRASF